MLSNKTKSEIKISNKISISNKKKCLIVAEISANHSGDLKILKKYFESKRMWSRCNQITIV